MSEDFYETILHHPTENSAWLSYSALHRWLFNFRRKRFEKKMATMNLALIKRTDANEGAAYTFARTLLPQQRLQLKRAGADHVDSQYVTLCADPTIIRIISKIVATFSALLWFSCLFLALPFLWLAYWVMIKY